MKKVILILLILSSTSLRSQDKVDETVYLHVSSSNILSGEKLHFAAFIISEKTGQLSELSSILYLELVDGNGESRHQSKIELLEGRGYGHFFIPVELETGIYHLTAYTRWMKNNHSWFDLPITIVNPYKSYSSPDSANISEDELISIKNMDDLDSLLSYKTRSPVSLELEIEEKSTLSISVSRHNAPYGIAKGQKRYHPNGEASKFVLYPEYQYGIVQGKSKLTDAWISSSFQSNEMEVDVLKTDDYGNFVMYYDPSNITSGLGNLVMDVQLAEMLEVYPEFYEEYPAYGNITLNLTEPILEDIKVRSINSQLMNAYRDIDAPDLVRKGFQFLPGDDVKVFILDEYKRFSSMRDTFIELIFEVSASKNVKNFELKIRSEYISTNQTQRQPMVLLDGIRVGGEDVLDISPYLVEKIEVLTDVYFIGGYAYHGIISVHTFKKDFGGRDIPFMPIQIQPVQELYEIPIEIQLEKDRTPHLEHLLYWNPNVDHSGGNISVDFTSSDFEGLYELSIRGVTATGALINRSKFFLIE